MKLNDETSVLQALGIESWRHLSKGSLLEFLGMLPEMDKELVGAVIGQFPEFAGLVGTLVKDMGEACAAALAANIESQRALIALELRRLEVLESELVKDLTAEQRIWVLEEIRDVYRQATERDARDKQFIAETVRTKLLMNAFAVVAALVFVGARVGVKAPVRLRV